MSRPLPLLPLPKVGDLSTVRLTDDNVGPEIVGQEIDIHNTDWYVCGTVVSFHNKRTIVIQVNFASRYN